MIFFKDKDNYPNAKGNNSTEAVVADFLKDDIQGCIYTADLYINAIEIINEYTLNNEEWEATGNAFTMTIKKNKIIIFNNYTEEQVVFDNPLALKEYISDWKKLIMK